MHSGNYFTLNEEQKHFCFVTEPPPGSSVANAWSLPCLGTGLRAGLLSAALSSPRVTLPSSASVFRKANGQPALILHAE